jgi:predicted hydrolase (HD superfamily)
MNREEAYNILKGLVKSENLIRHHLACEAAMKTLYERLTSKISQNDTDKEKWGIVGLLHDADYELSKDHPEKHTLILEKKIGDKLEPDVMYAIKSHNWQETRVEPKSQMDWSIYCSDELTGLIIAAALIHPDKKLASLDVDFIIKRFNEPSFAKGASRDQIKMCEEKLEIPLDEFIGLVLKAMQGISNGLGL